MRPHSRGRYRTWLWGTFAWCVNEPEHLIMFDGSAPARSKLLSDFDFSFQPMAEDKLS